MSNTRIPSGLRAQLRVPSLRQDAALAADFLRFGFVRDERGEFIPGPGYVGYPGFEESTRQSIVERHRRSHL